MTKKHWLIIVLVFIAAFWQVYKLYFGYEDLAFLYKFQHYAPELQKLLQDPKDHLYINHYWLIYPQWKFFGYHPLPYYLVSLVIYFLSGYLLYQFVKEFANEQAAFFATAYFVSGYFGIEAIWWNAFNGAQTYTVISLMLGSALLLLRYLKTKKIPYYIASLIVFILNIYLFKFRGFLPIAPIMATFIVFQKPLKSWLKQFAGYAVAMIIVLLPELRVGTSSIGHASYVPIREGLAAIFGNIGSAFVPLTLLGIPENAADIIFLCAGVGMLIYLALTAKKYKELHWPAIYLITTTILLALAVYLGGSPILIFENTSRFIAPILLGTSVAMGLIFGIVYEQSKITILFAALIIFNIGLANFFFFAKSARHLELKKFYTAMTKLAPIIPDNAVFQFAFLRPSPGPFVSGTFVPPEGYLAGIFGKDYHNIKISTSFDETIQFIKERQLDENHVFFFNYDRGEIEDMTQKLRTILHQGKDTKEPQEAFAPALLEVDPKAEPRDPDPSCQINQKLLSILARQRKAFLTAQVKTVAMLDNHKSTDLIDGDYNTSWTANDWGQQPFFEISFAQPVPIAEIRIPPLPGRRNGRMPTQYHLAISPDGQSWQQVSIGKPFTPTQIRYI
ncbi:glycosyltransferase family 39 protein, partial [Candidatus Berkelbacteria bacterium]|nr:glycosyltransferase family 39 protein [Candidatus Berkelbacteria bacterium]